jgi:hypothetical protein
MVLGADWAFNDAHTDLDETARLATGPRTLADWAATVAVTTPTGLPEDPTFGAGLGTVIRAGLRPGQDVGEQLRGAIYADERVADVDVRGTTEAGELVLPIRIEASTETGRWTGNLTPELIEQIIAEIEDDTRGEVL